MSTLSNSYRYRSSPAPYLQTVNLRRVFIYIFCTLGLVGIYIEVDPCVFVSCINSTTHDRFDSCCERIVLSQKKNKPARKKLQVVEATTWILYKHKSASVYMYVSFEQQVKYSVLISKQTVQPKIHDD
jgi:hypothetical protein